MKINWIYLKSNIIKQYLKISIKLMNVFEEIKKLEKKSIKSKSMFTDDYDYEMDTLVEKAEEIIKELVIPNYNVEYTTYWSNDLKVKISDDEKLIHKLMYARFAYNKSDVKFWYINLEISYSQKSQKTVSYKLWRFSILNHDDIMKVFREKFLESIEEY